MEHIGGYVRLLTRSVQIQFRVPATYTTTGSATITGSMPATWNSFLIKDIYLGWEPPCMHEAMGPHYIYRERERDRHTHGINMYITYVFTEAFWTSAPFLNKSFWRLLFVWVQFPYCSCGHLWHQQQDDEPADHD